MPIQSGVLAVPSGKQLLAEPQIVLTSSTIDVPIDGEST
jgi:hypothetical protein